MKIILVFGLVAMLLMDGSHFYEGGGLHVSAQSFDHLKPIKDKNIREVGEKQRKNLDIFVPNAAVISENSGFQHVNKKSLRAQVSVKNSESKHAMKGCGWRGCGKGKHCICDKCYSRRKGPGGCCGEDDDCDNRRCVNNRCRAGNPGDPCGKDSDCRNRRCVDDKCRAGNTGDPCGKDSDCKNKRCVNDRCRVGNTGDPCGKDSDCINRRCVHDICRAGNTGDRCEKEYDCYGNGICKDGKCSDECKLSDKLKETNTAIQDLNITQLQLVKDHNSYECDFNGNIDIFNRLKKIKVIEIDTYGETVKHDPWDSGENIKEYLREIVRYHNANPSHDPIWLNIDIKTPSPKLESVLFQQLSSFLYRPADLLRGHDNIRNAVKANGWPKVKELKGKIIVVYTTAFNRFLKPSVHADGSVGFFAPVANDKDDSDYPGDYPGGDLEGTLFPVFKGEIVMFNVKWGDRHKINYSSIYDQNLLLWFWDVPRHKQDFKDAVTKYKASFIGFKKYGQPYFDLNGDMVGKRGRDC